MRLRVMLTVMLWVFPTLAEAQVPLDIYLRSKDDANVPLPPGSTYVIRIYDRLPRYAYTILYDVRDQPIGSLVVPAGKRPLVGFGDGQGVPDFALPLATSCLPADEAALTKYKKDLSALTEEAGLPSAIATMENDLTANAERYSNCGGQVAPLRQAIAALKTPEAVPIPRAVGPGQDIVVTITRQDEAAAKALQWTRTFSGHPRGAWLTTYGFSFVTDWFAESNSFTARETATQGRYVIAKDATEDRLRFVPTVMFSWQPSPPNVSSDLALVLTGGLGFDFSDPVVLFGGGITWNRNLSLHTGIAAAKVGRLLGRYSVGDTVGNLTPGELGRPVYRLNPFVSLSFSFSSNPFTNGGKSTAEPAAKETAPSDEAKH